jgi:hypothetical protein
MFSPGSRSKAKVCPVPAADAIDRVRQLTENIIMKIRNASGILELAKLCDSLQLVLEGLRAVQTDAAAALIPAFPSPTDTATASNDTMPPGPAIPAPMAQNPAYSWALGLPQEAAPIPAQPPNRMTEHHMQAQIAVSVPQTAYHHPPLAHGVPYTTTQYPAPSWQCPQPWQQPVSFWGYEAMAPHIYPPLFPAPSTPAQPAAQTAMWPEYRPQEPYQWETFN